MMSAVRSQIFLKFFQAKMQGNSVCGFHRMVELNVIFDLEIGKT